MRVNLMTTMRRWAPWLGLLALSGVLAGCASSRAPGQNPAVAAPPPPRTVVTEAISRTVPIYSEAVAQMVAVQTVGLRAQVAGTLEQVLFKQGSEVRRGQLLFIIDQRPFIAALQSSRAQLATAQANLKQALQQVQLRQAQAQLAALKAIHVNTQQQARRDQYLVAQQALAQQQLDNDAAQEQAAAANVAAQEAVVQNTALAQQVGIEQARAGVEQAQAAVTQAQLNLTYTTIRAPIDGIVGLLNVDEGNLVSVNMQLATMSSVDPILAQFRFSEPTFLDLTKRTASEAARSGVSPLSVPSFRLVMTDHTIYQHLGTFRTLDRAVDPQTGTIIVQVLFPNNDRLLRAGMYAQVRAKLEDRPNTVLVPQAAVQEVQGAKTVFVVGTNNTVSVRTITDGGVYGPFFIVLRGLQTGERVIVEGLQKVRPGAVVRPTVQPAPPLPSGASAPSGTGGDRGAGRTDVRREVSRC